MNILEDGVSRSEKGRRASNVGASRENSYFSIKESRTINKDGRRRIEAKSDSPNPGPRYKNLGLRVCPVHDCWWNGNSGEFSAHLESHIEDENEWTLLLEPMYLFEELRPESPAPIKRKTKHEDRTGR